jgi:PKHD-type hydroxylase
MYKTLSNDPEERNHVTYSWAYWDGAFLENELQEIENICSSKEIQNAKIMGTESQNETEKIRKSKVHFFEKNMTTEWIFEKFNIVISLINDRYYNYNLNGYKDFQYTEYHASENGKYDWHMDMIHGNNNLRTTRKLSVVLCLSDPEKDFVGGEFQINTGNEENCETIFMKKGRMIFFPSYTIHRVKPVIQGIRKSIVIWVTGPKFI